MKSKFKRFLSMALAIVMVFGLLPVVATAVVDTETVRIEAETGTVSDGAAISDNADASGGQHVGDLGKNTGAGAVTFTVTSSTAGEAVLDLYYIQDSDRSFEVVVNGTAQTVAAPSSGSWTKPSATPVSVKVQVAEGENTIVVKGVADYAPNLDYMVATLPVKVDERIILDFDFDDVDVIADAESGKATGVKGVARNAEGDLVEVIADAVGVEFIDGVAVYPAGGLMNSVLISYDTNDSLNPMTTVAAGDGVTVSMWINTAEATFSSPLFAYGARQNGGTGELGASVQVHGRNNSAQEVVYYRDGSGQTGGQKMPGNGSPYKTGKWQLVTFVENGDGTSALYIDGAPFSTMNNNSKTIIGFTSDANTPDNYYIGSLPYAVSGDSHFAGYIGSVTVYGAALSAEEIAGLAAVPPADLYTVTLDSNGGSDVASPIYVSAGNSLGELPTPSLEDFNFLGWFDAENNQVTADTVPEANMALTAQWEPVVLEQAVLKGESVTAEEGAAVVEVPITLSNVDALAAVKGTNGAIAGIQFTVKGAEVTGFKASEAFADYDWGTGNNIVLGFNFDMSENGLESSMKIEDLGEDVEIGILTLKVPETEGTVEVTLEIDDICDDGPVSYMKALSTESFEITTTGHKCHIKDYSDIYDLTKWYHGALDYVVGAEIMVGNDNKLMPEENISRAEIVQLIYTMAGKPGYSADTPSRFPDVTPTDWYYDAVMWATENKIAYGYGSGFFGPNDEINREQLVSFFHRYAGSPEAESTKLGFADAGDVSVWSLPAVLWASETGIVSGRDNNMFAPGGTSMRAEAAQIIMKYCELFVAE